jgi:hypothetical protein
MNPVALKFTDREGISPFLEKHFSTTHRVRDALRGDLLLSCTLWLPILSNCNIMAPTGQKYT